MSRKKNSVTKRVVKSYYEFYFNQYKDLFEKICFTNGGDFQENFSLCSNELLYSMCHFNKKKSRLKTYVSNRINGKLKSLKNKNSRRKKVDFGYAKHMFDMYKRDYGITINDIWTMVTAKEKDILIKYFIENQTLKQIADLYCVSHTSIFFVRNNAINKIKTKFNREWCYE